VQASDIVEIVVLTADSEFLQTLREAVGSSRRVWHVPAAAQVADLLTAGQVRILVLDAEAAPVPCSDFVLDLKHRFADLVIVLTGDRAAQAPLGKLISTGMIYRFIHKPLSPARAQQFIDSAVRKQAAIKPDPQSRQAQAERVPPRHGLLLGCVAGVAVAGIAIGALVTRSRATQRPATYATLETAVQVSPLASRAAAALAANHLTEPVGDNALELYQRALAQNPADASARTGIAEVYERLCARAQDAMLSGRLDLAQAAIDAARSAGVPDGRITLLQAELAKSRDQRRHETN